MNDATIQLVVLLEPDGSFSVGLPNVPAAGDESSYIHRLDHAATQPGTNRLAAAIGRRLDHPSVKKAAADERSRLKDPVFEARQTALRKIKTGRPVVPLSSEEWRAIIAVLEATEK